MSVSFQHTPLMSLFYLNYCLSFSKTPEILSRDTTCLMLRLRAGNWPLTTARPVTQRRSPVPLAFARRVACNARRRGTVARVGGWVWSLCLGWGRVFVCCSGVFFGVSKGIGFCCEGFGIRVVCVCGVCSPRENRTRRGRWFSERDEAHRAERLDINDASTRWSRDST